MIALIQRVKYASVNVDKKNIAQIDQGLLIFLCAEREDTQKNAATLLKRLLNYRVFADENGKMNLSVSNIEGGILIVPQFTLAADTNSGTRPSFSHAAPPERGKELFNYFVEQALASHHPVATGRFGADMQVSLVNDGPVTFWLQTK